jgi:hypothetical protein
MISLRFWLCGYVTAHWATNEALDFLTIPGQLSYDVTFVVRFFHRPTYMCTIHFTFIDV